MVTAADARGLYASLAVGLLARATRIRLVLTDCDGVLTDSGVLCSAYGEEMVRFDRRDGMGVQRLRALAGIETGIVTQECSEITARRAEKLGIHELHLGALDKASVLENVAEKRGLLPAQIAFLGDDVNDLPAMARAGLAGCPSDAFEAAREAAHYVCRAPGGHGAFREFAELVLHAVLRETPRR
jgi:3-deoxy-D-manno-octulosonate 8-phosphate phosphatase (KDO 8-P phosphatase)